MFFFTTQAKLLQGMADVLLSHVISPQRSHLRLGLPPMLLSKRSKAIPIGDFVPTAFLEVGDGLTVPGLFFSFEP